MVDFLKVMKDLGAGVPTGAVVGNGGSGLGSAGLGVADGGNALGTAGVILQTGGFRMESTGLGVGTAAPGQLKCHRCPVCDGYGCPGNLPGLGGVFQNKNFQLNFEGWKNHYEKICSQKDGAEKLSQIKVTPEKLRCGPVTGAIENIGYFNEEDFYLPYLNNAAKSGLGLCIGDGCPDEKLKYGLAAVRKILEDRLPGQSDHLQNQGGECPNQTADSPSTAGGFPNQAPASPSQTADSPNTAGGFPSQTATAPHQAAGSPLKTAASIIPAFFLKPYPQDRLYERIGWIKDSASYIGIDIDSYNILTMRNLVHLERKTAEQLQEFRKWTGLPFVIKGVFTDEDIDLVKEIRPEVVYISNHGGRIETRVGSTADFLAAHAQELKNYCQEIWVDGGIRTRQDIQTALYLGADQVIMARPLIRATFDGEYDRVIKEFLG